MKPHIKNYRNELAAYRGASRNEGTVSPAFQTLLQNYCNAYKLKVMAQLAVASGRVPDGTIKDSMNLTRGYWEAKDEQDDLAAAIGKKIAKDNYPTDNILFENTRRAVLYQNGGVAMQIDMSDDRELEQIIRRFLEFEPAEIAEFNAAIAQFKTDLPEILIALRALFDAAYKQEDAFKNVSDKFLKFCQASINPAVEVADVREMLLQHILTKDIFLKVFDERYFHAQNNIASSLDEIENALFANNGRRDLDAKLRPYYSTITSTAALIADHNEKQKFLKDIYQDFYTIYNPKAADTLGVIYTPNEIVNYMIHTADALLVKYFQRHLYSDHVQILDPAVGTGTFITDLINFIPPKNLPYKYAHEIHANEVGILPYYIANLNIEYTYKNRAGDYKQFPNICFVDTLDNLGFGGKGQSDWVGAMTYENLQRVKNQNAQDISVIIGNPPYNANQRNENDNNKNREYPEVDARIKATYVKHSTAQKTKQYDMYKRFVRWASDRLNDDGIIAFITNRAYLDARQDDGFRKMVREEFNAAYITDLGGDIRANYGRAGKPPGNVFGIQTGVAIGFFIRSKAMAKKKLPCDIHYQALPDEYSGADKLAALSQLTYAGFDEDQFMYITPDKKYNWLNLTNNDFEALLPVCNKRTKFAAPGKNGDDTAIFKLYTLGVSTNRDAWVFDFDKANLRKKARFFAKTYNSFLGDAAQITNTVIKWSRDLKDKFGRDKKISVRADEFVQVQYRPFVNKFHCANFMMNDRVTKFHYRMFGKKLNKPNKVICFPARGVHHGFQVLTVDRLFELGILGGTQCLPLYSYTKDGLRQDNITIFGLLQFQRHYANDNITREDIFHYAYAVFHNPAYREKYAINLQREFPRLPFYQDFAAWVAIGKQLMDLHIGFEDAEEYALQLQSHNTGKTKLQADRATGKIILDDKICLTGIPPVAWEYKLGNRAALEWVVDQYKEKQPRDPTVREKFHAYRLADYQSQLIALLRKVCTVSMQTMQLIAALKKLK